MTRLQYLLSQLGQEGAEITQVASKATLFGLGSTYPGAPVTETNLKRIRDEATDLFAMLVMLEQELGLDPGRMIPDPTGVDAKIRKVMHYMQLSESLGILKEDATNPYVLSSEWG